MTADPDIRSYLAQMQATLDESAFRALCQTLRDQERWQELAQLHCQRANHLESNDAKALQLTLAAQLYLETLDDQETASQLCTQSLSLDPAHPQALQLRRTLQIHQGQPQDVRLELLDLIASTQQPTQKSLLLAELAQLQEQHLAQSEQAAVSYHRAFVVDPSHTHAYKRAYELYHAQNNWLRLIALLRASLSQQLPRIQRANALVELGLLLLEHKREDPKQIALYFREALDLDPSQSNARRGLQSLAISRFSQRPPPRAQDPLPPPSALAPHKPKNPAPSLPDAFSQPDQELSSSPVEPALPPPQTPTKETTTLPPPALPQPTSEASTSDVPAAESTAAPEPSQPNQAPPPAPQPLAEAEKTPPQPALSEDASLLPPPSPTDTPQPSASEEASTTTDGRSEAQGTPEPTVREETNAPTVASAPTTQPTVREEADSQRPAPEPLPSPEPVASTEATASREPELLPEEPLPSPAPTAPTASTEATSSAPQAPQEPTAPPESIASQEALEAVASTEATASREPEEEDTIAQRVSPLSEEEDTINSGALEAFAEDTLYGASPPVIPEEPLPQAPAPDTEPFAEETLQGAKPPMIPDQEKGEASEPFAEDTLHGARPPQQKPEESGEETLDAHSEEVSPAKASGEETDNKLA